MRPIRLEVSGFGVFREATVVDFEGADFFALVGPTGSGKSTVIDAICFALYGSVPRYDDRRLIAPIVTMGAQEAKVSLVFDVGAERYQATRVVRRTKTGATTPEARLERLRDGEVLAGRANEMEAAVELVLGLPFAHFTKCVVLPQGEFARFLHDKPADRQQLLVELLNLGVYTRMGQEARAQAAQLDAEVGLQQRRLDELAELATPEHRRAIEQRATACGRLAAELQRARGELEQLTKVGEEADRDARRSTDLVARLRAVTVPREVAELTEQRERAEAALAAASADVAAATAAAEQQAKVLAELPDLARLLSVREAHGDLRSLREESERAIDLLSVAEATASEAGTGAEAAERRRTEALAAQEALRTEHRAHAVARTLHAGDTCPVCRQTIATLPKLTKPAGIDRVDRAVEKARKEHELAAKAREQANVAVESSKRTIDGLRQRVGAMAKRVEEYPDSAAVVTLIETVEAGRRASETARHAEAVARRAFDQARTRSDAFAGRVKEAAAQFRSQRDPLLQYGVELPEPHDDLLQDWKRLAAWAGPAADASERDALAAGERAEVTLAERRALLTGLAEACGELGIAVASPISLDGLIEGAVRAEADAKHELNTVKSAITEVKRLRKAVASVAADATVAKTLGTLLQASKFERWLVAEALDLLVADASRTLEELSGGQYSLAFDDSGRDFFVVDHRNADERRLVRTLSGGETFQASLALALALSDQLRDLAADGAARLESIFLDEGFGTLDPDTLDTVAATIETLAFGDRMVGLITHVAELSDRVPVRFVVTKGPRTATVEKVLT